MGRPFTLEFDEVAADRLQALMERFGESSRETMVARALGLLETIVPFLEDDGALVVVDPRSEDQEDYLVRLTFENASGADPRKAAA